MTPDPPTGVPSASSADRDPLATGLEALRATLDGAAVRLEVIGLVPGRADHERHTSRAEARVLVTAEEPAQTVTALLTLQADAARRLEAVPDHLWPALGRAPEAAFVVAVPVAMELPHPDPSLVRYPLEVQRVSVPDPQPAATRRP